MENLDFRAKIPFAGVKGDRESKCPFSVGGGQPYLGWVAKIRVDSLVYYELQTSISFCAENLFASATKC